MGCSNNTGLQFPGATGGQRALFFKGAKFCSPRPLQVSCSSVPSSWCPWHVGLPALSSCKLHELQGSSLFIGWSSIQGCPRLRGFPGHRSFMLKPVAPPPKQGWVGHPIRLTHVTPKSICPVSLLIAYSPFPTTLGNTSLVNPTFASKDTFLHSFVYSANTSWTPCVMNGWYVSGKRDETMKKRDKSLCPRKVTV